MNSGLEMDMPPDIGMPAQMLTAQSKLPQDYAGMPFQGFAGGLGPEEQQNALLSHNYQSQVWTMPQAQNLNPSDNLNMF